MQADQRVASDIGGTFTDIAYIDDDGRLMTGKVPSTPENYAAGVVTGIGDLLTRAELASGRVGELLHGCTVATNAILEQKGAATALLTTRGFRDILELRRIRVPRLYEPLYVKPPPLVPRRRRLEITERMDAAGRVLTALDEADVVRAIERLAEMEVEAVAVCFLHAYANPAHERRVGEMLRAAMPGAFISLSVDVLPEIREYERTSTTVINAYVGPPVKRYLDSMVEDLSAAGLTRRLMVMQSSGGILDAATAADRPAQIVECGPAAGVIAARELGRRSGYPDLITFDMGGTTAKAAIIEKGRLMSADEFEVGGGISTGGALGGGGGYALKLPAIDISEVGAGGGSIVWIDKAGALKVGPESAGAVPGPACYGQGGEAPTVTDANVVLGYLSQTTLAGGSVEIEAEYSRRAIVEQIARPLGRDLMETAHGIHTVANANMMRAVKAVTTYRGRDPRDFSLVAFGGNGGVHGVDLARVLRISKVIVPPAAGVFSAIGLLNANRELNLSAAFCTTISDIDVTAAERVWADLEAEVRARFSGEALAFRRLADMRYGGQAFELTVPLPDGPLDSAALAALGEAFEDEHERRYGHKFAGAHELEIVNLRLIGVVPVAEMGAIALTEAPPPLGRHEPPGAFRSGLRARNRDPDPGPCPPRRPSARRPLYRRGIRQHHRRRARLSCGPRRSWQYRHRHRRSARRNAVMSANIDPFQLEVLIECLRHHRRRHRDHADAHVLFRHHPRLTRLLHGDLRSERPDAGPGGVHADASRFVLRRHAQGHRPVRGAYRGWRRLHLERSLHGRRAAPAGHLHRQADLLAGPAGGLVDDGGASFRRRRHRAGQQRAGRGGDLPGGAAPAGHQVRRGRPPQPGGLGHRRHQRAHARVR